MPNRILRDYTDSLRFDGISAEGERLFIRLLTKADDYGRFHADPRLVCAACFPLERKIEPSHVAKWLKELVARGLVLTYEVNAKAYVAVINYGQRLRNSRVKFPPAEGQDSEWLPTCGDSPRLAASCGDFPPESESESETESKTLGRTIAVAGATASVRKAELSDEDWLKELATNPAYDGLDVAREFSKMQAWCAANRKQATRRRFVNWLNRVDKPLNGAVLALNGHTKPKPLSVWELKQSIEQTEKEISRLVGSIANKVYNDDGTSSLRPDVVAKVKAMREKVAQMRQTMSGLEVAA